MTTELGRLVNDLVNAAHKCGAASPTMASSEYESLWSAQVAAEKALLKYVEKRERELRGRIERLAENVLSFNEDAYIPPSQRNRIAEELRALLK